MPHKILKLFVFLSCILAIVGIVSCSSDNKEENTPEPPINAQEVTLNVSYETTERSFSFDAAKNWHASSDATWCTVTPEAGGAGKATVTVKIAENPNTTTRIAKVSVTTGMYSQSLYTINVTQDANPKQEDPVVPFDPLSPDEEDYPMVGNMSSDAIQLVDKIKVGWNLGNSCESDGSETSWGNPKVTPELIAAVKAAGFNAVRVPVRWYKHADKEMTINEDWLKRISEIIDYCVNEDMYVIINSHHDNWYDRLPVGYDAKEIKEKFAKMWTQIARYYRDYDEHLIFAGVNEMICLTASGGENWGAPTSTHQNLLNDLQTIFVTRVRATSGNNAVRCLMIQPWACNTDFVATSTFKMPKDRVDSRLIYDFHQYTWTYSTEGAGSDNKYFWGEPYKGYSPWFSNGESELDWRYDTLKRDFIDKGIPVVMSEFGCVQHNKTGNDAVADECRAYYHKQVVGKAKTRGIKAFYWDNGLFDTEDNENFGLFDRKNNNVVPARAQIALDGIMAGAYE